MHASRPVDPVPVPDEIKGDTACHRCGGDNFPVWFTDSPFWNAVVRSAPLPWLAESDNPNGDGLMCWTCFVVLAYERGFDVIGWHLRPETRPSINEDQRRKSVLFNDVTAACGSWSNDDSDERPWLTLSERQIIADFLWKAGWRRDVRPEDINDKRTR